MKKYGSMFLDSSRNQNGPDCSKFAGNCNQYVIETAMITKNLTPMVMTSSLFKKNIKVSHYLTIARHDYCSNIPTAIV